MALNAYMRLKGSHQGDIKGDVTQAGREESILVVGFNHAVTVPTGPDGIATGKYQHEPLIVTKNIDIATPGLMNALVSHEEIEDFELRLWRPRPAGAEEQWYTIQFDYGKVVDIRYEMLNNKYPENMKHEEYEYVSFVYKTIIWTYEDAGITAEATWVI